MNDVRTEEQIMSTWSTGSDAPVVSVCCIAFNHREFIEDAIKGFLTQVTNFPIEILIYDDASTDGTTQIIEKYASLYPRIIHHVLQQQNQYSKGKRWFQFVIPISKGSYIAVCEGDDYWCDPRKLQIQYDFLQENPNYVISGHDARVINKKGEVIRKSRLPDQHKRDYSSDELQRGDAWILTMSWFYRNLGKELEPEKLNVLSGDYFFISILGEYGKSHYHHDIEPAAYRIHQGGVWSILDPDQRIDSNILTYYWMYKYYQRICNHELANLYWSRLSRCILEKNSKFVLVREVVVRLFYLRQIKHYLLAFQRRVLQLLKHGD